MARAGLQQATVAENNTTRLHFLFFEKKKYVNDVNIQFSIIILLNFSSLLFTAFVWLMVCFFDKSMELY